MSFPCIRDIATRQARPRLASHAPNVNITIEIINSEEFIKIINEAIIRVKVKIIASKTKRAINKWFRWIDSVNKAIIIEKGVRNNNECDIASRVLPNFWFTRPGLLF